MPLRQLLRQLLNDERVIQKIQDSEPVRKAARAVVVGIHKGKAKTQDALKKLRNTDFIKDLEEHSIKPENSTYEQWKNSKAQDFIKKASQKKKEKKS